METTNQDQQQPTRELVDKAGNQLSSKLEEAGSKVGPRIDEVSKKAKALAERSIDAVGSAAQRAGDKAVDLSDTLLAYTKENPVTALLLAGAAGAVLVTLLRGGSSSKD